ncbi:GIY-YIG nuclease family protein [Streptomyces anulatus]
MTKPSERITLDDLYDTIRPGGVHPFIRELYPEYLRYWQYLGTGREHCKSAGPGIFYEPAEDYDSPLNYVLSVRRRKILPSAPTAVYRLRDNTQQLLYVGISDDPLRRWPEHAKDKPWWQDVANFSIEWFGSRPEALTAEALAIKSERPLHNIVHNADVHTAA